MGKVYKFFSFFWIKIVLRIFEGLNFMGWRRLEMEIDTLFFFYFLSLCNLGFER